MEICYLRGSPWSLRIILALHCLPNEILENVKLTHTGSADSLKKRVTQSELHKPEDKDNKVLTLPMMFYENEGKEYVIRNGIDIVEYFCETVPDHDFARNFLENKAEIFENNEKIDRVCRFGRNMMFTHGSDFLYYLVPSIIAFVPGLSTLVGSLVSSNIKKKYSAIGSKYTKEQLEEILQEFDEKLENGYIFGEGISYNDITLFATFEFIKPTHFGKKPLGFVALSKKTVGELEKFGWEDKFKNIYEKKDIVFQEIITKEIIDICHIEVKRPVASL